MQLTETYRFNYDGIIDKKHIIKYITGNRAINSWKNTATTKSDAFKAKRICSNFPWFQIIIRKRWTIRKRNNKAWKNELIK